MRGILLDIVYALGLIALSPIWLYRMIRHGRYRQGIAQRFGAAPIRYSNQPVIWVHGVSLGEVNAARSIVQEIHRQMPDFRVMVSSTTDTGLTAARKLFEPDHIVFNWPLDFSLAVARALDRVRPSLVVLMEGEVWPNFLAACNKRQIPAVVVNARMSADKGYPRYKKMGSLAARLFNRLAAIGAQDEGYAERFRSLGIKPEKIHVTGMMKFDTAVVGDRVDGQDELAGAVDIAAADRLIVAGGTGDGEEQIVLEVFRKLQAHHAGIKFAIVPRKPERFDEVARQIQGAGMGLIRRSEHPSRDREGVDQPTSDSRQTASVILGDTMGELRKFYALATCVFVGRSLVPMGGSDMIEAAALGKPTCFGPHTFNFPQAADLVRHGCARVADAAALERQLDEWLTNSSAAVEAGKLAQQYVISQQGATRRNVEMICEVLGREPALTPGAIATDRVQV